MKKSTLQLPILVGGVAAGAPAGVGVGAPWRRWRPDEEHGLTRRLPPSRSPSSHPFTPPHGHLHESTSPARPSAHLVNTIYFYIGQYAAPGREPSPHDTASGHTLHTAALAYFRTQNLAPDTDPATRIPSVHPCVVLLVPAAHRSVNSPNRRRSPTPSASLLPHWRWRWRRIPSKASQKGSHFAPEEVRSILAEQGIEWARPVSRHGIPCYCLLLHGRFVPSICRSLRLSLARRACFKPATVRCLCFSCLLSGPRRKHGPRGRAVVRPSRGYGYGYGVGSAAQQPPVRRQPQQQHDAAAVATGGVLKRSMAEVERWQQQLYLRAVRQRVAAQGQAAAHPPIDITAALARAAASRGSGFSGHPSAGFAGLSPQPSSTLSSLTTASRMAAPPQPMQQHPLQPRQMVTAPAAPRQAARPATAREMVLLHELEKQLLGDDDDGEAEAAGSACGSTVTSAAWGDTMQELNNSIAAAPLPSTIPMASSLTNNRNNTVPVSRSPADSASSSTASSTASSSPPTTTASPRQLLSEAAAAVFDGNRAAAAAHLAVLKTNTANPRGGDAEQRLVAMMAAALSSRIAPEPSSSQHLAELCGPRQHAACQLLHDVSPCFGLALHGANLAILDAVAGSRAIHVIDFDVSVAQHMALIQALAATRRAPGSTPTCLLKVTAVADPTSPFAKALTEALPVTALRLKRHAQQAGVEYRFRAVSCRAGEIDASRLGCEPGEAVAVNLAFALSRVPDESVSPANPRDELLRRVRALAPRVVTLVEQELNTNTAPVAARFADACAHYGAVLESLDATLARHSEHRARAEEALGNKAANAVAREGADRVERCEVFGKWRARFGMAGLRPVAIGQGIADRVKARLGHARPGFDVKLDGGRLGVGWMGRVVTVASAWG